MPLVRIDLRRGKPAGYAAAIGEGVHRAMLETIGVPERDHFQVITEHPAHEVVYDPGYLGVSRSDDIVLIQIFLSAGRTTEQKQALYARIATLLKEKPGVRPEDVFITLVANAREDWSFGKGEAQYVTLPREQWK
jgi:4-oxalocrotonate tautomerase